jgi:hypothetical protein
MLPAIAPDGIQVLGGSSPQLLEVHGPFSKFNRVRGSRTWVWLDVSWQARQGKERKRKGTPGRYWQEQSRAEQSRAEQSSSRGDWSRIGTLEH